MGTLAVLPFLAQKGNQTNYQRPLFFFLKKNQDENLRGSVYFIL